jgi:uncharacterized protein YkwD
MIAGMGMRGRGLAGLMAVVVGWRMAAGSAGAQGLPCREDDRLSEAAAALLLSGEVIRSGVLLARARAVGFDGVAVHARESAREDSLKAWLSALREGAEGSVVCGEARTESRRLVLASVRGGGLVREGELLRGGLEPGFRDPTLVIESGTGELVAQPIALGQLQAGFTLPDALHARRVQLIAESASGPRPVAELALTEDAVRAAPRVVADANDGPKTRPVETLLGQLSALRRELGASVLRDNRLLSESAQRHATRVCELGKLAHRVEGEDPELRLAREHVSARGVGEVMARAQSSDRAFQALLESPSHRMALGRRDFTDAGIGQASDAKGQVCLVVLMASWPRRTP